MAAELRAPVVMTVDMNKPCKQCGRLGASHGNGLCLGCLTKYMQAKSASRKWRNAEKP